MEQNRQPIADMENTGAAGGSCYISGESHKKDDNVDRITRIADNGLDRLDAIAMWKMMKLACSDHERMANKVIRIERPMGVSLALTTLIITIRHILDREPKMWREKL